MKPLSDAQPGAIEGFKELSRSRTHLSLSIRAQLEHSAVVSFAAQQNAVPVVHSLHLESDLAARESARLRRD
jgi:hypothetical protein